MTRREIAGHILIIITFLVVWFAAACWVELYAARHYPTQSTALGRYLKTHFDARKGTIK